MPPIFVPHNCSPFLSNFLMNISSLVWSFPLGLYIPFVPKMNIDSSLSIYMEFTFPYFTLGKYLDNNNFPFLLYLNNNY